MNVAAWLRGLGLERYIQAFENNDVDAHALRRLTEADLVAIGVSLVGHRRKLAGAIAALDHQSAGAAPPRVAAERRQLSVLYCQMVEPAASGPQLDAEERRELIRRFHKTCTDVVLAYDGHVANFYGDCMLAYFGWPRAHEDDAERAARAGLVLARQVHSSRSGVVVQARVGAGTGAVVVGDLIHEGPAQEQSAVGLTPNLAARLLGLAAPGQVVIDELTRRLLAPSFAVQPLGSHALKGISGPTVAYVISGERAADSRFDAHKGHELDPIVGRGQELALLKDRWAQACGGEGTAVLLVGEAGIGKSRLARALLDACAAQPHALVRWQCSPYYTGSALWPVIQRLGRASGLGDDDSNDAALDKLEAFVGAEHGEAAALYATLLGLNGAQRYGPLEMAPQVLRERTLELLAEKLFGLAEQRPLLLVVEDAHWIDPTTLELIGRCLATVAGARMLILITSRLDNQPALAAHPEVMRLSLNRLDRASVEAIVSRLGGNGLHAQTLATIVAQTDGVPLFVEELTKAVLETGEAAIPASLHGSLMARLDRIPGVKEVAQIAACIGREFDQALLDAVAERPDAVAAALDKLAAAELVFRRGGAHPRFTFKHALVQEAAHESLLRSRRQAIHASILRVLETERPDTPAEVLAHHAAHAREDGKAIAYWQQAGDAALAKSAYAEAAGYLERAIALSQAQPDDAARRALELELQLHLGQAHIVAHGFAAPVTRKAFVRAHELLAAVPHESSRRLRVEYGLWASHAARAELDEALRLALVALEAARTSGDAVALQYTHRMVAASHLYRGELAQGRAHFEQAMALLDAADRAGATSRFGVHPAIATLSNYAWLLCIQGCATRADELLARARLIGSAVSQVNAKAYMHFYCAMPSACLRDRVAVAAAADALIELATRYRLPNYGGDGRVLQGWVALESGRSAADAVAALEQGLSEFDAIGSRNGNPIHRAWLASALSADGRHEAALRAIERALAECEETRQRWCDAELWRVRGEVLRRSPHPDLSEAARCFEQALAIARTRGAKLWELRAAVSLARLRADQGDRDGAIALLRPVHDGFTEGSTSADLVEAGALLGALAQDRPR